MPRSTTKTLNEIFRRIQKQPKGISLPDIAHQVFHLGELNERILERVVISTIKTDKRFVITKGNLVRLSRMGKRDLRSATFVVVDVETTGSKFSEDRITEIGAVKMEGGEVVDEFKTLINPGQKIAPFISRLTGITDEMVWQAPTADEVMPRFLNFMMDSIFVAHNARFDWGFINRELERTGYPPLRGEPVCTVRLSRKFIPHLKRMNLDSVSRYFDWKIANRHRALDDARAAAEALRRFWHHALGNGMDTIEDFIMLQKKRSLPFPPLAVKKILREVVPVYE